MAILQRKSLTRWENGVPKTYFKGDDVPDLKSTGVSGVFLTREEAGKVPGGTTRPVPAKSVSDQEKIEIAPVDIIQLLEGNVASVTAHVLTVDQISVLEDILVAEGEGKNRSTVTAAINDRIKALEEG